MLSTQKQNKALCTAASANDAFDPEAKQRSKMFYKELTVGPIGTRCYLLGADDSPDCVVIDPGAEAPRIRRAAEGRSLSAILLTHGHFDHIAAVRDLMDPGVRLFIHPLDAPMLSDPDLNAGRSLMGVPVTAPAPTDTVSEGDRLSLAGLEIEVLHTPGHTPGGVCYRIGSHLFTGDTLFDHGWGRTDLPGGDEHALFASLRRLMPLARTLTVHPGHHA